MSDNPAEKRPGFERWVQSLKLGTPLRPSSSPPPPTEGADGTIGSPLTLDEQATLINRIPKEVIYKLRERDSQRAGMPKNDDSTAVFTPPPELLARAKRFQAPPKPERSSPNASEIPTSPPPPMPSVSPDLSAAEAAAFASLNTDEEATTYFKPDIAQVPSSLPPPLAGDASRAGDIQWIDGLASSPPEPAPQPFVTSAGPGVYPSVEPLPPISAPPGSEPRSELSSVAPSERRLRWIAIFVALVLLGGIYALSRMQ
ncbi:MAG TPA: hypothetical protein VFZ53_01135 [Polyangiaceae bacterium]